MDPIAAVTGTGFEPCPRRPGDPARIVANEDLAARDLGWKMRHSLQDMVTGALAAAEPGARRSLTA